MVSGLLEARNKLGERGGRNPYLELGCLDIDFASFLVVVVGIGPEKRRFLAKGLPGGEFGPSRGWRTTLLASDELEQAAEG